MSNSGNIFYQNFLSFAKIVILTNKFLNHILTETEWTPTISDKHFTG